MPGDSLDVIDKPTIGHALEPFEDGSQLARDIRVGHKKARLI
ncbi:MAG: hypothetical protein ABL904_14815 [Hyphomicrobiaceae bacterium]